MGGTSTDVSRFSDGKYEHVVESTTAGVTIQAPQLDINTVAAGGGSMLFFRSGLFVVGPESASGKLFFNFLFLYLSINNVTTFKMDKTDYCFVGNSSSGTGMLSKR